MEFILRVFFLDDCHLTHVFTSAEAMQQYIDKSIDLDDVYRMVVEVDFFPGI